jgi:hypothetical protein
MSNAPASNDLVRVVHATQEEQAACLDALGRTGQRREQWAGLQVVGVYFVVAPDLAQSAGAAPRYLFCQVGTQWKVIFDGGTAFYLKDTLGPKYLDPLLHRPNLAIRALDLEKEIQPEKAKVRARGSIQRTLEGAAMWAKLRELETLRAEREEARDAGDEGRASRLDGQIQKSEAELEGLLPGDAGQKARCNVSQAVKAVRRMLEKGNRKQRAFAEHLKQCLSLGFECMYIQPAGNIWR